MYGVVARCFSFGGYLCGRKVQQLLDGLCENNILYSAFNFRPFMFLGKRLDIGDEGDYNKKEGSSDNTLTTCARKFYTFRILRIPQKPEAIFPKQICLVCGRQERVRIIRGYRLTLKM